MLLVQQQVAGLAVVAAAVVAAVVVAAAAVAAEEAAEVEVKMTTVFLPLEAQTKMVNQ